jgi:ribosomal protein L17
VLGEIGATVRGDFEALTIAKLPGEDRKVVKDVIKSLCRKYTHARLGGYIRYQD